MSLFNQNYFRVLALSICVFLALAEANPFGSAVLYKDTDPITQLSVVDFKSTVLLTSNAWLIEFYSSWCGHCVDFAPTFIQLANDVKGWEKVIKIGAIDCAKDENIPICREYEVMGYPTLKFFPAFSESGQLGNAWKGPKKIDAIRKSMVDFVETQHADKKAASHWPILGPLGNETLDDLWAHYNNEEMILLFEETTAEDYWSREALLDAYQYVPGYPPIRRVDVSTRKDLVDRFNVQSFPSMVFLEHKSGRAELYKIQPSREFLAHLMKKFFSSDKDESSQVTSATTKQPQHRIHEPTVKVTKDQVYMADLEGALLYAFGHEVVVHKVIAGKELAALKELIRVLDAYFPARPAMKNVIHTIKRKLDVYKKSIRGQEFAQIWEEALGGNKFGKEWIGCRGSLPHLRGYPCSLWTTFHALTVNYALHHEQQKDSPSSSSSGEPPAVILYAMKGYIKYFFGCAHCSNHFVDMTEDEMGPLESVSSPKQSVLWLWAAHNKVNRRIASDASEDPAYPKIQFPNSKKCPGCLHNESAVLEYLTRLYRPESISSEGLTLTLASEEAKLPAVGSGGVSIHSVQIGSLSFTNYDVSLYAVIYLSSAVILIAILARMLFNKRKVRKNFLKEI